MTKISKARKIPKFSAPRTFLRRRKIVNQEIKKALGDLHSSVNHGYHLGAGGTRIEGLVNCDLFDPKADIALDAISLESLENNSIDLIEHHHMVEHLSLSQFDKAMKEWVRVLKKDGYLIMTFPDILRISSRYLKLSILNLVWDQTEKIDYTIKMFVGSQEHEGMFHKNHFDQNRMTRLLASYGLLIEFNHPYPPRPTPSLLVVARKQ